MKIWNFFAIFGVSPEVTDVRQQFVFYICLALAVMSTIAALVIKDKEVTLNDRKYEEILNTFYGWFCVLPLLFLAGCFEWLLIMVASFNIVIFWLAFSIGVISFLIRFALFDGDRDKVSAYGVTRLIQKWACNYILTQNHNYPGETTIGGLISTHQIRKTQQKYLSNGQQGNL